MKIGFAFVTVTPLPLSPLYTLRFLFPCFHFLYKSSRPCPSSFPVQPMLPRLSLLHACNYNPCFLAYPSCLQIIKLNDFFIFLKACKIFFIRTIKFVAFINIILSLLTNLAPHRAQRVECINGRNH